MSVVRLCQITELNKDYKNVYDFSSRESQLNFMQSKTILQLETNAKIDNFTSTITLNYGMNTNIRKCDYLFSQGMDGKYLFFFIDNLEQVTTSTVKVYLTLDVWQTYHLGIQLQPSYVVRQHVKRWNADGTPSREIVSENFPQYEYISQIQQQMASINNGSYIYVATSPLGLISDSGTSGGGGDNPKPDAPSGSCQADGILSYDGFRFIKGYEGFTPSGAYLNGESFRTVGYGFTEKHNPQWYERHKPFPCSEQKASELFGELGDGYASQIWAQCQKDGIAELLTKSMFDAMVSTAWNVGVGGFLTYDTSPYQLIKVNPFDANIENVWKKFAITGSGVVMPGLIARREAEANIYFKGEYEMRAIVNTSGGIVDGDGFIPERYVKCQSQPSGLVEIEDENGVKGMFPCASGRFTNVYPNYNDGTYHGGIDLSRNDAVNIYPPRDNMTVVKVVGGYPNERNDSLGYGNYCILEDNETKQRYWFGHMRTTPLVQVGDTVNQNTVLGNVGTSGYSTGPHLHYEIRVSPYGADNRINPIKYIYSSDGSKHEPKINETFTRGEK